jgi:hypothetical protein
MSLVRNALLMLVAVLGLTQLGSTHAQQASPPRLEYLMSYKALLEPPMPVDSSLVIVNVKPRLNGVQAVNKGIEFKLSEDGYVIDDVYIVRP